MVDDLKIAVASSVSSLRAQSTRMRILSENLANATATASTEDGEPYRRKIVSFRSELDRASGASVVRVQQISRDSSPFPIQNDPGHPAADKNGNVKMPNVNSLVELADMREASRSYEASLQVVKQTREMIGNLVDLLRVK
ncbi:MAG: flagellar basal body rod protein FlgC [Hyphomicrobiaceae bacterium]|uniref:flagellar basal body rod protein FlgC n=1 Tax=Pseudorhodoplanes sp. TaxID=1934341 RepID=UPI003D0C422A